MATARLASEASFGNKRTGQSPPHKPVADDVASRAGAAGDRGRASPFSAKVFCTPNTSNRQEVAGPVRTASWPSRDDPTAVPPAVLATMSRQLGIDTTTDLTGYRDGKWRFAHAAQIRTEHGYRDLADRAAGFGLTRWLYAQCWTGTERPSALFDRATTWMLAHKVLLPGATTLERFVAKLRHRVDVPRVARAGSGISPPQGRYVADGRLAETRARTGHRYHAHAAGWGIGQRGQRAWRRRSRSSDGSTRQSTR